MFNPASDDPDEKPLDPAAARLQARLQRLMLIAGLTLGFGILAVFGAVVYRINVKDEKAPEAVAAALLPPATIAPPAPVAPTVPVAARAEAVREAEASVPADARLIASTVAGNRIVLTYEHFAGTLVMIVDPETLQIVGRLEVAPTP